MIASVNTRFSTLHVVFEMYSTLAASQYPVEIKRKKAIKLS
jgi:hypothetical protein